MQTYNKLGISICNNMESAIRHIFVLLKTNTKDKHTLGYTFKFLQRHVKLSGNLSGSVG